MCQFLFFKSSELYKTILNMIYKCFTNALMKYVSSVLLRSTRFNKSRSSVAWEPLPMQHVLVYVFA